MLATPTTSHVSYDRVYEPAEDSFLLLDTLSSPLESAFLHERFSHRDDDRCQSSGGGGDGGGGSTSAVPVVYELGSGSGVVIAFVAAHAKAILGRDDVLFLSSDINREACSATAGTVTRALLDVGGDVVTGAKTTKVSGDGGGGGGGDGSSDAFFDSSRTRAALYSASLNANLTDCLRPASIDILIFNPPYVPAPLPVVDYDMLSDTLVCGPSARDADVYMSQPTSMNTVAGSGISAATGTSDTQSQTQSRSQSQSQSRSQSRFEKDSYLLSLSYAGGEDGMQVTNDLLARIPSLLSPDRGVAYVLLCAQNKPDRVIELVSTWEGGRWSATVVGASGKKAGWEKLVVLRICRTTESM